MTTIKIVCIFEMYFLYVYMLYIHKYSFGFQIKPGVLETVVQLFAFFFVCFKLAMYSGQLFLSVHITLSTSFFFFFFF